MTAIVPQTPAISRRSFSFQHKPMNSSPLTWDGGSSPTSSPTSSRRSLSGVGGSSVDRRRTQYKSHLSSRSKTLPTPSPEFRALFVTPNSARSPNAGTAASACNSSFLKEQLRAKVIDRAVRERKKKLTESQSRLRDARAKDVQGERERRRREQRMMSSDGFDEDMDMNPEDEGDDDDDDDVPDEIYRRIMVHANGRALHHRYRASYSREVGPSSWDPCLEDPAAWEQDLAQGVPVQSSVFMEEEYLPDYYEEEELAAYAEEAATEQAELDDISLDELFAEMTEEELSALTCVAIPEQRSASLTPVKEHPGFDDDVEMS